MWLLRALAAERRTLSHAMAELKKPVIFVLSGDQSGLRGIDVMRRRNRFPRQCQTASSSQWKRVKCRDGGAAGGDHEHSDWRQQGRRGARTRQGRTLREVFRSCSNRAPVALHSFNGCVCASSLE